MSQQPSEYQSAVLIGMGEYFSKGEVTAKCPACGSVIEFRQHAGEESVWLHSCACSQCNGSMRGF